MKFELGKTGRNLLFIFKKHSPEILTGVGIAGMVSTTILAVRATPKALILLEKRKEEESKEKLDTIDIVKTAYKPFIPVVVTGALSITCLVGGASINARRNAALLTAYTLAENGIKEYKDKVVEVVGEKKEKQIRDEIDKDKLEAHPIKTNEVIIASGDTLCFDTITSRYFMSDIEKLRRAENNLNRQLMYEMYVSLNDYYGEIGLPSCDIGDDLGWNANKGMIELNFSSRIADDGRPCLVVSFRVEPRYDFRELY